MYNYKYLASSEPRLKLTLVLLIMMISTILIYLASIPLGHTIGTVST